MSKKASGSKQAKKNQGIDFNEVIKSALLDTARKADDSWVHRLFLGKCCQILHGVCSKHGSMCDEGAIVCFIAESVSKQVKNERKAKERAKECLDNRKKKKGGAGSS